MNHFLVGDADKTTRLLELASEPFLLIDDGPIVEQFLAAKPAKLFDIAKHDFNPLKNIDYKRARDIAAAIYTANPEGKDTLTVRNGKRALTRLIMDAPRLDKLDRNSQLPGADEALATIDDILLSPALRRVLCAGTHFKFTGNVVVKLDRASIGDFDAFLLASLLIGQHQGQIIVPDFGFYGREYHSPLVRQERLIAAVTTLAELPPRLSQLLLSVKDKTIYRTTREDAERLVFYTRHENPRNLTDQTGEHFIPT